MPINPTISQEYANTLPQDHPFRKYMERLTARVSKLFDGIYVGGYTKEKILATPKGLRPKDARLYLRASYIAEHLQRFKNEGEAFIIVKRAITDAPPERPGFVPRKFVGLKSEMDRVITEFNSGGKDLKILADKLDLGESYFKPGDEVFYITVKPDGRFTFDMPSGTEPGAFDGLWIPGGYTKKYHQAEAVIVESENLKHDRDWNKFVEFFGSSNVNPIN